MNTSDQNKNPKKESRSSSDSKGMTRRDVLKSLATFPVAGALLYGAVRKKQLEHYKHSQLLKALNLDNPVEAPAIANRPLGSEPPLRLGIIGTGGRGIYLMRSAGFIESELIDEWTEAARQNKQDNRIEIYQQQEDLNVQITGICDVFTVHRDRGLDASANLYRTGKQGKKSTPAKVYNHYKDLLKDPEIDAVIIATPDHWHAPMIIEAAKAGKHIYVEKPLSMTVEETYEIEKAVLENNVVLQLGHQNRQIESHNKAREVIKRNLLGKITLIETFTNRNDPHGAWVYDIHPETSPETVDWQQFLGPAPYHPFSKERFFRWRCWWDYGTGLTGDLFTHEFDAVNQVMDLGIPHSAMASGGIFFFKDGRTVPDVMNVSYEYPDRDLILTYTATQANSKHRKKTFYGHDGYMELDMNLVAYADRDSTQYRNAIYDGVIPTDRPIITHTPGRDGIDAISSPTEQYFASRGLLFTYQGGRRVDTTHLHIKEWLNGIRHGTKVSCGMQESIEEAISAHLGTVSYREGKKTFWNPDKKRIELG